MRGAVFDGAGRFPAGGVLTQNTQQFLSASAATFQEGGVVLTANVERGFRKF